MSPEDAPDIVLHENEIRDAIVEYLARLGRLNDAPPRLQFVAAFQGADSELEARLNAMPSAFVAKVYIRPLIKIDASLIQDILRRPER